MQKANEYIAENKGEKNSENTIRYYMVVMLQLCLRSILGKDETRASSSTFDRGVAPLASVNTKKLPFYPYLITSFPLNVEIGNKNNVNYEFCPAYTICSGVCSFSHLRQSEIYMHPRDVRYYLLIKNFIFVADKKRWCYITITSTST